MPQLVANQPPPDHYYADNVLRIVASVEAQYGDLLTDGEREFARCLGALSPSAIRLFARLVMRKGPWVRIDRLNYREVDCLEAALAELASTGMAHLDLDVDAETAAALLTLDEIKTLFPTVPRKSPKADYVADVVQCVGEAAVVERVSRAYPCVAIAAADTFALFRILFFGDAHHDLSEFVMRDLGLTEFEPYPLARERRLFGDRGALEHYLELVAIAELTSELGDRPCPETATMYLGEILPRLWSVHTHRVFERKRSRILNRFGRNLERIGQFDAALTCYTRSTLAPARERRARILRRLGDDGAVDALKRSILQRPRSAIELDFAKRFPHPRRRDNLPIVDLVLRKSSAVDIELAALSLLTANGGVGWHLENQAPMALFGLAYWHWVFAPIDGMFVNEFQSAPLDLFWPDFFATRQAFFAGRRSEIRELNGPSAHPVGLACGDPLDLPDGALGEHILAVAAQKEGVTNRLVNWQRTSLPVIERLIEAIPEAALRRLLLIVRRDLDRARTGFPDLTVVYGDGHFEFVEVKGPGDQLQQHQIVWIEALIEAELPVRVLRCKPPTPGDEIAADLRSSSN